MLVKLHNDKTTNNVRACMGIKKNVFASSPERHHFKHLIKEWGGKKYNLYHNLPFLNIFDVSGNRDLSDKEKDFLKKSSIDYTICDKQDKPIFCIEFDGMYDGFNVGSNYELAPERKVNYSRRRKMELKLRIAYKDGLPMIVAGTPQFKQISEKIRLTIIDGIIGDYFSQREIQEQIARFSPQRIKFQPDEWKNLTADEKQSLYQDYIFESEINADNKHNPIYRELVKLEFELELHGYSVEYLMDPDADEKATPLQRGKMYNEANHIGAKVTVLDTKGKPVTVSVWLPNVGILAAPGTLAENIAHLLALDQIKKERAT